MCFVVVAKEKNIAFQVRPGTRDVQAGVPCRFAAYVVECCVVPSGYLVSVDVVCGYFNDLMTDGCVKGVVQENVGSVARTNRLFCANLYDVWC